MQKADLEALLARVEKAEGPDKQLGLDIGIALGVFDADELGEGFSRLINGQNYIDITSSTDAAVALCERVLPMWDITIELHNAINGQYAYAEIGEEKQVRGATIPLALLSAILRAKIAEAKE